MIDRAVVLIALAIGACVLALGCGGEHWGPGSVTPQAAPAERAEGELARQRETRAAISTEAEGSAAIVQLGHGDLLGLLAIGSKDPERFSSDMGTLFVRYIGDILARRLVVLTGQADPADGS